MQKYEKGEIAEIVLEITLAIGAIGLLAAAPGLGHVYKYFKPRNSKETYRIKRSIKQLATKGFLLEKKDAPGVYVLTLEGERRAMQHKIKSLQITKNKTWDQKWRVIMFDVPEDLKQARRGINFALKRLGCVQYQKSVFVTPFPCEQEIEFVGKAFNIRSHIKMMIAESLEGEESLKKHFNI